MKSELGSVLNHWLRRWQAPRSSQNRRPAVRTLAIQGVLAGLAIFGSWQGLETNALAQSSSRSTAMQRAGRNDIESRLGLTRMWHDSVPASVTNPGNQPLKFVMPRESTVAFSLTKESITGENPVEVPATVEVIVTLDAGQGVKEVVSSRERGLNGQVLGVKGALRLAEIRKELLERRGLTVNETVDFVPSAMVIYLSNEGQLQAMDAETGAIHWSIRLEKDVAPIIGFDVSDEFVAVTHGSHIDLFDISNGVHIRKFPLQNLPDGPPVLAGDRLLSPGINGRVELLSPFGTDRYRSDMGGFHGRLALSMTELDNVYVWAVTDQLYVSMKPSPARPVFSVPTSEPLQISPAGFGNLMLVAEADGALKCVSQSSGVEVWSEYATAPVVQTPAFVRWTAAEDAAMKAEAAEEAKATPPAAGDGGFGQPADNGSDNSDPFATPPAAQDPFATPPANRDPFATPAKSQDPFASGGAQDPFATGGNDPFAGAGRNAAADAFDSDEEPATGGIRQAMSVDVEALIGTEDRVAALLVEANGQVTAIDLRTGKPIPAFRATGIRKIMTVTRSRIYATSTSNELVSLDIRTGKRLGALPIPGDWEGVTNSMSDRVYLQSRSGQLVCFRPNDSVSPKYTPPKTIAEVTSSETNTDRPAMSNEDPGDEFNPFGGAMPPLGGSAGAEDDPFK